MKRVKVLQVSRRDWTAWSTASAGISLALAQMETARRLLQEAQRAHDEAARQIARAVSRIDEQLRACPEVLLSATGSPTRETTDGQMTVLLRGGARAVVVPAEDGP